MRYYQMAVLLFAVVLIFCGCTKGDTFQWTPLSRADPHEMVHLTLALRQVNTQWLKETLLAVSDPDSPRYGQYLTLDQINQRVHPTPESVSAVKTLFESHGVLPQFTPGNGHAVLDMTVAVAEDIFSTTLYSYRHSNNNDWIVTRAATPLILPTTLSPHVAFACCLDTFPQPKSKPFIKYESLPDISINPKVIDEQYNISGYRASNKENAQAVAGFLKQYFSPKDLAKFQDRYDIPSNPIKMVLGKNVEADPGGEASLDVQYITGVGKDVPTWFVSTSTLANHGQEDFLSWLVLAINMTVNSDNPILHSVSYGDYEDTIPPEFIHRCDEDFMKLGTMGVTILFASGDDGVNCKGAAEKFRPNWPASSPYVTSVGGTVSNTEAWTNGGGGFSNVFPMPDYQKAAVDAYLNSGVAPKSKYFNSSGRAYPDVSAFATGFLIIVDGMFVEVGGTSCSAPTVAGIVSLLNDVRHSRGAFPLGFLNPLLYKKLQGNGFIDITKGENSANHLFCPGFKATKGWDPASGWGSPNFGQLRYLV